VASIAKRVKLSFFKKEEIKTTEGRTKNIPCLALPAVGKMVRLKRRSDRAKALGQQQTRKNAKREKNGKGQIESSPGKNTWTRKKKIM